MKTIIAGSRETNSPKVVSWAVAESRFLITEVVSGGCRGADLLGEEWAAANNIPVRRFPADWSLGKKAGPIRNRQMAEYAEALIAIWDGQSRGTKNMIDEARARGLQVYVFRLDEISNARH